LIGDEREQQAARAGRLKRVKGVVEMVFGKLGILEINTGITIHLEIEERWGEGHTGMKAETGERGKPWTIAGGASGKILGFARLRGY